MQQLGEFVQENNHLARVILFDNLITNKGIEIFSEYIIGNTSLKSLNLGANAYITDASVPFLLDIAKKSQVTGIYMNETSISKEKQSEIEELLSIPIDQREIPIKSNSKSAAKISIA